MHKLNLRKVVSAAEAAKTPEERWRLISWGIMFEGSMMLRLLCKVSGFLSRNIDL